MRGISLFVALVATLPVSAQTKAGESDLPKVACPYPDTTACHSFQELYAARDPELLDDLSRDHEYICFLPTKEDVFFVIWWTGPESWNWEKDEERSSSLSQGAGAMLVAYKDGIFDEDAAGPLYVFGKWYKPNGSAKSTYIYFSGHTDGEVSGTINIDYAGFQLSSSFKNEIGSRTDYKFTMQRSTGRFREARDWQASGETTIRDEHKGRCVIYRK